ncbi:MAG: hypothetical protein LBD68_07625 [Zoogloeaceae bacterium]|jgi:hypothetical protein|nr:hypothetical protein [Zoogloeaceae bacterium]
MPPPLAAANPSGVHPGVALFIAIFVLVPLEAASLLVVYDSSTYPGAQRRGRQRGISARLPWCSSQGNRMNAIRNGSDRGREEKLLARESQKRFAAMELTARAGLKAANLSFWRCFARTVTRQTTRRDDKCIHAIALVFVRPESCRSLKFVILCALPALFCALSSQ